QCSRVRAGGIGLYARRASDLPVHRSRRRRPRACQSADPGWRSSPALWWRQSIGHRPTRAGSGWDRLFHQGEDRIHQLWLEVIYNAAKDLAYGVIQSAAKNLAYGVIQSAAKNLAYGV